MNTLITVVLVVIGVMILLNIWLQIRGTKVLKFRNKLRKLIYDHYLKSEYSLSTTLEMIDIDNDPDRDWNAMVYSFKPLTFEAWLNPSELYILFPEKYPQYKSCV